MINRTPQIVSLPTDFHKDLVQVPLPLRTLSHGFRTAPSDLVRKVSAKMIDLMPHRCMADVDPALVEKVFDIAQRQRKSNIHHHRKLDDFWRVFKVAERVLGHFLGLNDKIGHL